jgi:preprotein translocase subunit SecF
MVELFRNPEIDWIGAKKYFIGVTIFLLILGAISVQIFGFSLGVDFAGGTLLTVRFKQPPVTESIRSVLGSAGIDTTKVILQPVTNNPNEMLIRCPQLGGGTESERRVDEDKRTITRALQALSPAGNVAVGKVNVNTIEAEGIEQELRQVDPFGINKQFFPGAHPYRAVGDQIVSFRDSQPKRFLTDINTIQSLSLSVANYPEFDAGKVKQALSERLYAGKIDLNLIGVVEIENALNRIDPLGSGAAEVYAKAAKGIGEYRKASRGVISDLGEIPADAVSPDLASKMAPYFTEGSFAVISAAVVGPQVGADLRNRAIYVTLAALAGMLVYIAFRFQWIYGVAAVTAVFHDVMITLGFFSLFHWEISLTVIAALLTLVGYSMNDTIVIFDRIRENTRLRRRDNLVQITNDAINQTLSRTVITSGLTFTSVIAIVLFGGEVLRGFALALTIGIIIGTYSSIAVASPIMLWWEYMVKGGKPTKAATGARTDERSMAKV